MRKTGSMQKGLYKGSAYRLFGVCAVRKKAIFVEKNEKMKYFCVLI